jgi:hypothetical protein
MHHLRIAIAASAVLLAGIGPAGAAGVTPPSLGSEPRPYAYGAPHGYGPQPAYGPTPPYALAPYTYSLPHRYATHPPQHAFRASPAYGPGTKYAPALSGYGPASYADGLPPSYGSNAEQGMPPRTYHPVPYAMPHDTNARLKHGTKSPTASQKPSCKSGRHHHMVTCLLHDPQLVRAKFPASLITPIIEAARQWVTSCG